MENMENTTNENSSEVDEKSVRFKRRIVMGAAFAVLAAAVIYMGVLVVRQQKLTIMYNVIMTGALLVFWVLTDVVSPLVTKELDSISNKQKQAYYKYALLELVGYAGLAWFASSIGGNNGIYGAVAFMVSMMYKKRFHNEYLGIKKEGEEEEESSEEVPEETEAAEETAVNAGPRSIADRARMMSSLSEDEETEEASEASEETE